MLNHIYIYIYACYTSLLTGLLTHNLTVSDINYVIATHGHIDHVGNLNLFSSGICTFIVGHDIYNDCYYTDNDLDKVRHYRCINSWLVIWITFGLIRYRFKTWVDYLYG